MEVQLVRVNLNERYAGDEDIGRKEDRKEVLISSLDAKIEKGDVLYSLASGIAGDYRELEELGDLAREMDIELSLHTPYYMDLADADGLAQKSVQSVIWGGMLAAAMGAPIVVTHLGMFGELEPKEAMNRIAKNLRLIRDAYKKGKIRSRLGIEASGRTEVVGSLDELLTLVKNAKGVLPVLNFAHVHARGFGLFKRPEDFDDVLSKVEKVSDGGHIHAHFNGGHHRGRVDRVSPRPSREDPLGGPLERDRRGRGDPDIREETLRVRCWAEWARRPRVRDAHGPVGDRLLFHWGDDHTRRQRRRRRPDRLEHRLDDECHPSGEHRSTGRREGDRRHRPSDVEARAREQRRPMAGDGDHLRADPS